MRILLLITSLTLTTALFGQNEFGFDMMDKMEQHENLLFSPTSIKAALAMAYDGANNDTQKEFEDVFGFDEQNSAFIEQLKQLKESAKISNSVWILKGYDVLPAYIDSLKSRYDAPPNHTDFKNKPAESAEKINKWIENNTDGMIKKMLTPESVEEFKLALVNAIYFNQDWKLPFDESRTIEKDFNNLDGTVVKANMMRSLNRYRAYDGKKEKVIELSYNDDKTSMIIVLPNKMQGYDLDNNAFTKLNNQLTWQKVNMELPKFTFEIPTFEVRELLMSLGLKLAFTDVADFSGMREEKDLKIGNVLHKAKIIVNEKGTEAAAATVVGMVEITSVSVNPDPIMEFKADKPFFYFIKDNATGTLLFMGKMNAMG